MEQWKKDQNTQMLSRKSIKADREMSVAERKMKSITKGITMWTQEEKGKNDSPLMFIKHALFL